jgi:hypothetical protein
MYPAQGKSLILAIQAQLCLRFRTVQITNCSYWWSKVWTLSFVSETATETFQLIKQVYGDNALSRTQVFEWFKWFKDGHEDLQHDPRCGRPDLEWVPKFRNGGQKSSILWDTMTCSPLKVKHAASMLCLLHASCWFTVWLTLLPWRWRLTFSSKTSTFTGLHGITSKRRELFNFMQNFIQHSSLKVNSIGRQKDSGSSMCILTLQINNW